MKKPDKMASCYFRFGEDNLTAGLALQMAEGKIVGSISKNAAVNGLQTAEVL